MLPGIVSSASSLVALRLPNLRHRRVLLYLNLLIIRRSSCCSRRSFLRKLTFHRH